MMRVWTLEDLQRLAVYCEDYAESSHEIGNDYDEDGKSEMAARHWGSADAYRDVARYVNNMMLDDRP